MNNNNIPYWNIFKDNFRDIINNNEYYNNLFKLLNYNQQVNHLFYGINGFPIDLFIDELIKEKFNINYIYRKECIWNKNIHYNENQHFFELDMLNPNMPKDFSFLTDFILHIIKTKSIISEKHFIIIKNIDVISKNNYYIFRIIFEKFYNNVYFLCTTTKINKLENPIKSRFFTYRFPLFTIDEMTNIFTKYFNIYLNPIIIKNNNRNIIFAIFIAELERCEPQIVNEIFISYNFPLLYDFIQSKNKDLHDIRQISYKCCQYNISILKITLDFLKKTNKNKQEIINIASNIDYMFNLTNKGREPIFIESLMCQLLL